MAEPSGSSASEAVAQTTNARQTLRQAEQALEERTVAYRVRRALDEARQDVAEWALQPVELWRLPRRELRQLDRRWKGTVTGLVKWQRELGARRASLKKTRARLRNLRAQWEGATAPSSGGPSTSAARASFAAEVIDRTAKLDARIDARLASLWDLQQRVADESVRVAQVASDVEDAVERAESTTMQAVAPPLWKLAAARAEGSLGSDAEQVFAARRRAWAQFLGERSSVLWTLLALLAGISATLWLLRRRHVGSHLPPEAVRLSAHLLSRPISAALLLTVLCAPFIVSGAPPGFFRLLTLLLLIPLLRLLAPLVPSHVRPLLYGLAALMVVDHVRGMFAYQIFVHRTLLVGEALMAGAALWLWVARRGKSASRALRLAATGGAHAFAASALANAGGFVPLADVIVSGLRVSAYVGVVLYAGTMVLDAVFVVALHSAPLQRLHLVRHHRELIHRRLYRTVVFAAVVLWVLAALAGFAVVHPVLDALHGALTKSWDVGGVHVSLSRVLLIAVVLWGSSAIARLLRFVLDEEIFPRTGFGRGKGSALSMIVGYAVLGVGVLVALGAAGVDATQVTMLAGALGVGIGFGLQNIVSNFVAGIILILERPVNIGDFIEVDELVGEVQRIGVRSSTVRGLDGAEVIVPNERLISEEVINWTLTDRIRRIELPVGVAYGTAPAKVIEVLEQVATTQPGVLPHPHPMALFRGFGDSSLDFELLVWIGDFASWRQARSELGVRVTEALEQAGMEIPFPQRDLHVRSLDESLLDKLGPPTNGADETPVAAEATPLLDAPKRP